MSEPRKKRSGEDPPKGESSSPPTDEEIAALLSTFVRRRPKIARLSAVEILQVVARDDFKCRVCGVGVEAHPRTVIKLDDETLSTICDGCRTKLFSE